jgi:hypothetical protein
MLNQIWDYHLAMGSFYLVVPLVLEVGNPTVLVLLVQQALPDLAPQDHKDHKDLRDHKVPPVLEQLDHKDLRDHRAYKAQLD